MPHWTSISGLIQGVASALKFSSVLLAIILAIFPITPSQYTANIVFLQIYEYRYAFAAVILIFSFIRPLSAAPMIFIRIANISSHLLVRRHYVGAGLLIANLIILSGACGFFASSASQLAYSYYRQIRYHGSNIVRQKLIQRANFFAATGNLPESNEAFRIVLTAFPNDDRNNSVTDALEHNLRMIDLSQALFAKGTELVRKADPTLGYEIVATGQLFWPKNPDIETYLTSQRTQLAAVYAEDLRLLQLHCREPTTTKAVNFAQTRLPYALKLALAQPEEEDNISGVDLVRRACALDQK